jgi:uncharacterized protein
MLGRPHDDALDAGPRKAAPGTERFCVATHAVKPVDEMIRFVVAPDGVAVPDLKRRLPGRGLWITATRQALETAIQRKAFARAFKRDVRVSPDLVAVTERLFEQAALDALAICHKAGKVAIGFAKTELALTRERVAALINAAEAAADGTRKLKACLHHREDAAGIAVVEGLSSAQLDLALGRSNVIHAALLAGPESETFLTRIARLDCFRAGPRSGPSPSAPDLGSAEGGKRRAQRPVKSGLRRDGTSGGTAKRAEKRKS